MKRFRDFIKGREKLLAQVAEGNTYRCRNGKMGIAKDDPWYDDDVWERDFQQIIEEERSDQRSHCLAAYS